MHDLAAIAAFRKVAETKNFTTAAHELQMTPSGVSRQITRLEDRLGVQLLVRSTRHLRLTEVGEQFNIRCGKGLLEIDQAVQLLSRKQDEPQGRLRIGVTPFFGRLHLVPAILDFLDKHPKISVDISLSHSEATFYESSVDVLVRAGKVRGQNLIREALAPMRHVICATPDYLKKHGLPATPKDLTEHNCLLSTRPTPIHEWPFIIGNKRIYVPVSGNFQADSVEALYGAVLHGTGIARLPMHVVGPELRSGQLRSIFPSGAKGGHKRVVYDTTTNIMRAYYVKSRHLDPKIRALIRFLKARFTDKYDWEHRLGSL